MTASEIVKAMGTTFPPASIERVEEAEKELRFLFPQILREIYAISDGLEGRLCEGARYFTLWTPERIVTENYESSARKAGREYVLFGSDGGGELFCFDAEQPGPPVVALPLIGDWIEESLACGRDFSEFVDRLRINKLYY
jgi:hypothetical protein